MSLQGAFVLVRGGFDRVVGGLSGVFCLEGFVRGGFCPSPFCQNTSTTTESKTSLSILGFMCMKSFLKCDVTCFWTLPSVRNCHTFSDPSPFERNVLYGRAPWPKNEEHFVRMQIRMEIDRQRRATPSQSLHLLTQARTQTGATMAEVWRRRRSALARSHFLPDNGSLNSESRP